MKLLLSEQILTLPTQPVYLIVHSNYTIILNVFVPTNCFASLLMHLSVPYKTRTTGGAMEGCDGCDEVRWGAMNSHSTQLLIFMR